MEVPAIRDAMERAARDGYLPEIFGQRNLRDPRHDPAEFPGGSRLRDSSRPLPLAPAGPAACAARRGADAVDLRPPVSGSGLLGVGSPAFAG